jgi:Crp-like helix-turn-helix domain
VLSRPCLVTVAVGYARPYPRSAAKPSAGCAVVRGAGATLPAFTARPHVAGQGLVGVRRSSPSRLFPDRLHRIPTVRPGRWRVGGNLGGRQRRPNWYRAVHGRGNHPEPRYFSERGPRLPADRTTAQGPVPPLGVRREGVTEAAGKLQKLGVIEYRRGQITVLDRPKLEQLCCERYAVVKKESDRLLSHPHRDPMYSTSS